METLAIVELSEQDLEKLITAMKTAISSYKDVIKKNKDCSELCEEYSKEIKNLEFLLGDFMDKYERL